MEYPLSQLRKFGALSDEFIRDLSTRMRRLEPAKNNTLLLKGDICRDLYLIEKGMLICYEIDEDTGKRYCSWLFAEGEFVTAVKSFNNQVASNETIIAVTNCILWVITKQDLEELSQKHPEFAAIRQILTDMYKDEGWEMGSQRNRPPEQFYEYLDENYPDIVKKAPATALAALMGISRTKLYEIIKNRPKKK